MSRVGRKAIEIPSGVTVAVENGQVNVQGPKGKVSYSPDSRFSINVKDKKVEVVRPSDDRKDTAKHGLIRSLINNMVIGVTKGYSKELEIRGVGFKAAVQGKKLLLNLGYSHQITYDIPEGITMQCAKATQIIISGIDKAQVGEVAAELRELYLPEPYKGKGIRYQGEHVRQKAGKKVA